MEHILNPNLQGIDFPSYRRYLDTIQQHLPPHVYAFASDESHYNGSSPDSLHDAWLESLTIQEVASGSRHQVRRTEIRVSLLGPYHDRRIHLTYAEVSRYAVEMPPRYDEPRYTHTGHGDLYTHELRLGPNGLLIHEILFERDATILIECADMRHCVELFE